MEPQDSSFLDLVLRSDFVLVAVLAALVLLVVELLWWIPGLAEADAVQVLVVATEVVSLLQT